MRIPWINAAQGGKVSLETRSDLVISEKIPGTKEYFHYLAYLITHLLLSHFAFGVISSDVLLTLMQHKLTSSVHQTEFSTSVLKQKTPGVQP